MKLLLASFLVVASTVPTCALSAESEPQRSLASNFGFKVQLQDGWVLLGANEVKHATTALDGSTLGVPKADKATLNEYINRVKTGKVEFYLDTLLSTENFTNNVSVQLNQGREDYSKTSQADITSFCGELPQQLERAWGTQVQLKGCTITPSNGPAVLAYSYTVPTKEMFILQYELPFDANRTVVVVGGGRLDSEVLNRVRAAVKTIVTSISERK